MDHSFEARGFDSMVDTMRQILQNDAPWKFWVFGLELSALMANSPTDVYEHRLLGAPVNGELLKGIHGQPGGHVFTAGGHVCVERVPLLWHFREELEDRFCCLVRILEDCVFVVHNVFEACLSQESG